MGWLEIETKACGGGFEGLGLGLSCFWSGFLLCCCVRERNGQPLVGNLVDGLMNR